MKWGDVQQELGLTGSRARSLYNRGGGKPVAKAKASGRKRQKGGGR